MCDIDNLARVCELLQMQSDASASMDQRLQSLQELEQLREQPVLLVPVAFLLAEGLVPPTYSYLSLQCQQFGFNLLCGHVIARWDRSSAVEKKAFRERLSNFAENNVSSTWQKFIKDACARLICEVAKREWPQAWPNFIPFLDQLSKKSTSHRLFVMLVFLRLGEDVFELDNLLTVERRRDLRYSLIQTMEKGFLKYLISSLESFFNSEVQSNPEEMELAMCTIDVLTAFLPSLPINVALIDNASVVWALLGILISPKSSNQLRSRIVNCLTLMLSNDTFKHKPAVLDLFDNKLFATFEAILRSADYDLFKESCRFFCTLTPHIISLWTDVKARDKVGVASQHFSFLLELTRHPSQYIASMTTEMWFRLLRNVALKHSEPIKEIVPQLMPVLKDRLLKVGLPSSNNHASCQFAKEDFTSDEEFVLFFSAFRTQVMQIIGIICGMSPRDVLRSLERAISECIECFQTEPKETIGHPSASLTIAHLDGAAMLIAASSTALKGSARVHKISQGSVHGASNGHGNGSPSPIDPSAVASESDLNAVASSAVRMLLALSENVKSHMYLQIAYCELLAKLCRLYTELDGSTGDLGGDSPVFLVAVEILSQSENITAVSTDRYPDWLKQRCFLSQFLLELASDHGSSLATRYFGAIYERVWPGLQAATNAASFRADICISMEALLLLANYLPEEARNAIISELTVHIAAIISEFEPHLSTPLAFAQYVGLTEIPFAGPTAVSTSPAVPLTEYLCRQNKIRFGVRLLHALLKRFRSADAGGQIQAILQTLLPRFLSVIRVQLAIWSPSERARAGISQMCALAFDISDQDKKGLLGMTAGHAPAAAGGMFDSEHQASAAIPSLSVNAVVERFRNFVHSLTEFSFQLLAQFAQLFGSVFYLSSPTLGSELASVLFVGLEQYPPLMLKTCIRAFVRPFCAACPTEAAQSALCPVLQPLVAHLIQLLRQRWARIVDRQEESDSDTGANVKAEIIETETTRQLTQEYISLLSELLVARQPQMLSSKTRSDTGTAENTGADEDDAAMMDDSDGVEAAASSNKSGGSAGPSEPSLSAIGRLIFSDANSMIWPNILELLVISIGWPDTWTCSRSIAVIRVCLPAVLLPNEQNQRLLPEEGPRRIMWHAVQGFAVNGQHEEMQSTLVGFVLNLFEIATTAGYSSHKIALKELAGLTDEQLNAFEADVATLASMESKIKMLTPSQGQLSSTPPSQSGNKVNPRRAIREVRARATTVLLPLIGRPASKMYARGAKPAPIGTPVGASPIVTPELQRHTKHLASAASERLPPSLDALFG